MEKEEASATDSEVGNNLVEEENMLINNSLEPLEEDCAQLLHVFPVETWELVIIKLANHPDDLEGLSNSSPFFRNLMASQRTTFLFEKVLALVAPTIWRNEGLQGLPVKDILNCRQVSSHWNLVVDQLIPQQFQYFGQDSKENQATMVRDAFKSLVENHETVNGYHYDFEGAPPPELVQEFLPNFERTHPGIHSKARNPFIWGQLSIEVRCADENDDGYEDYLIHLAGISAMLMKYGRHVDHFKLEIDGNRFYENMAVLRHWFSSMPNIKQLFLRNSGIDWPMDYEPNFEGYRGDNPFPKLEYLEALKSNNLPAPVFNQLVRQNSHISALTLKRNNWTGYDFFSFHLPNLKLLKLKYGTEELVERLASPHVQWPLESLDLLMGRFRLNRCASLFQVIHTKFASTLVSLEFNIFGELEEGECRFWKVFDIGRLNLPKLRKIKLSVRNGEILSLDLMLPMKDNLEEITLYCELGYRGGHRLRMLANRSIVQFMGFEGKMLKSNIWGIFNKLKKMKVEGIQGFGRRPFWYSYSREEWMKSDYFLSLDKNGQ